MKSAPTGKSKQSHLKSTVHRPLSAYIEAKKADVAEPKTIRAPAKLWTRLATLAEKNEVSLTEIVVEALTKVCDEEGV